MKNRLSIRINETEKALLEKACLKGDKSISEIIRGLIVTLE